MAGHPIDAFLTHWAARGGGDGLDLRLRVYHALALPGRWDSLRLRVTLRSLLALDPGDAERFDHLFAEVLSEQELPPWLAARLAGAPAGEVRWETAQALMELQRALDITDRTAVAAPVDREARGPLPEVPLSGEPDDDLPFLDSSLLEEEPPPPAPLSLSERPAGPAFRPPGPITADSQVELDRRCGEPPEPLSAADLDRLAYQAGVVCAAEHHLLDLPGTVQASIRQGGMLMPVYQPARRVSRLCVAVPAELDPISQATVDCFAGGLRRHGVPVQVCVVAAPPEQADVALLVVDAARAEAPPAEWLQLPRVALLEARDPALWRRGEVERLQMGVFPLDAAGLGAALASALSGQRPGPSLPGVQGTSRERLGAALPLAAACALCAPCDLATADQLRRLFTPHLPFSALQRVLALDGITADPSGWRFSLALRRWLVQRVGPELRLQVLRFQERRLLGLSPRPGTPAALGRERELLWVRLQVLLLEAAAGSPVARTGLAALREQLVVLFADPTGARRLGEQETEVVQLMADELRQLEQAGVATFGERLRPPEAPGEPAGTPLLLGRVCPVCQGVFPQRHTCPKDGAQLLPGKYELHRIVAVEPQQQSDGLEPGEKRYLLAPYWLAKVIYSAVQPGPIPRDVEVVCLGEPRRIIRSRAQDSVSHAVSLCRETRPLVHPNLVDVIEVGVLQEGNACIVTVPARGTHRKSLWDWLTDRGRIVTRDMVFEIWRQALAGIAALHQDGHAHLLLEPDGILLQMQGTGQVSVKIERWGSYHEHILGNPDDPQDNVCPTGNYRTHDRYAAPEQAEVPGDARADVYALGMLLIDLLSMVSLTRGPEWPLPLARAREALQHDAAVHPILWQMLAADPEQRPASAAEVIERLAPVPERPPQGRQQGRYQLLERVAWGSWSEFYRARTTDAEGRNHLVMVKRLAPHVAEDDEYVQRFVDEAKIRAALQHENLVRIYEFCRTEREYFIAMEYVDGKDVHALVEKARQAQEFLPQEHVAWIVMEVARGLHAAHAQRDQDGRPLRIVHRTVSPGSVLLSYRGEVKLGGFAVAKATLSRVQEKEGVIPGKVSYMSPEQAMGRKLDHRSDLFSLGTMFYEMLTLQKPFQAPTEIELIFAVRDARKRPARELRPDLDPRLEEILDRAMARSRSQRFQSGEEMVQALEGFLSQAYPDYRRSHFGRFMRTVFAKEIDRELRLLESYVIEGAGA